MEQFQKHENLDFAVEGHGYILKKLFVYDFTVARRHYM